MIVIILIAALYLIAEKQYKKQYIYGSVSQSYVCDDKSYSTERLNFYIKLQNDGQHHLIIVSKPQTDIVVTKTELGPFNNEYEGTGIDIKDSTGSLQVIINGKLMENCGRLYQGI